VLGPHRAHLVIGRELAARGSGLGTRNRLALVGRKGNRRRQARARELHNDASDFVLFARRQETHGFQGLFKELCHKCHDKVGKSRGQGTSTRSNRAAGGLCTKSRAEAIDLVDRKLLSKDALLGSQHAPQIRQGRKALQA
jgi:hypothetical protein